MNTSTTERNVPQTNATKTPWLLVRKQTIPAGRLRVIAKLMPTFADRGMSRGERNRSLPSLISVF
jgi:hypothetical protein